jgi:hypothetical protein
LNLDGADGEERHANEGEGDNGTGRGEDTDDEPAADAEAVAPASGSVGPGQSSSTTPDAPPANRRAEPDGTDTDPELDESTRRMMAESVAKAGEEWSRTNPYVDDAEKHPTDWTVGPIEGRTPEAQAMRVAREDNRVLARHQNRLEERLRELQEVEDERDRFKFTAETYLKAMDELMGERERYRAQLKRAGLLSEADTDLPDDPVKRLKQILRPMVRREDVATAKETLTGLDAVLREYEEANEQIQADERERQKQRGVFSRFFG